MAKRLRIAYPRRTAPRAPDSVRAKLAGPYDLEAFSLEVQKLIARLQDMDVRGIEKCNLYFTPLDGSGGHRILLDAGGKPVAVLEA